VQNTGFTGNNAGTDLDLGQSSSYNITVQNNTYNNQHTQVINMVQSTSATGGTLTASIKNNTIGTQGAVDSGSAIGSGVRVANGAVNVNVTIDSNIIHEVPNGSGVDVEAQSYNLTANVKYKIVNNTVVKPTGTHQGLCGPANQTCPADQVFVLSDNNGGPNDNVCTVISGNTIYDPTSLQNANLTVPAAFHFALRDTGNALQLEGTQANATSQINATNTITNQTTAPYVIDENNGAGQTAIVPAGHCGSFPP
jgi:hypothetical protein